MPGRLITLEGGEGAGKSTAVTVVRDWLEARGHEVVATREPGGTRVAEAIRDILLDPATGELVPISELLLMFAARAENLANIIEPALAAGKDVVCDRFTDASMAYQGGGRELGFAAVETLAGLVHPHRQPDLTLLLDVPVETGMQRIRQRGAGEDRFESTRAGFLERVRQAYLQRAEAEPGRFVVIDASVPIERVHAEIARTLDEQLA